MTAYDSTLGWRFVNARMQALYGTQRSARPPSWSPRNTASRGRRRTRLRSRASGAGRRRRRRGGSRTSSCAWTFRRAGRGRAKGRRGVPSGSRWTSTPGPRRRRRSWRRYRPVFRKQGGTVTAGNSSGINDGAAAVLLASEAGCKRLGRKAARPLRASGVAGVEPRLMGLGPIPATRKALARAGLDGRGSGRLSSSTRRSRRRRSRACASSASIPRASTSTAARSRSDIPLGASGARLVTTLVHELARRRGRCGLATMCIGVGQGITGLFERT